MSYITFKDLGPQANVGSQLLQYTVLKAIARENNKKVVFNSEELNKGYSYRFFNLIEEDFEIKPPEFFNDFVFHETRSGIPMDHSVFSLDSDKNYSFYKIFSNAFIYTYPKNIDILKDYKFNSAFLERAKKTYETIKESGKETVSIHVRLGDYTCHDQFCQLSERSDDYYERALQYFTPIDKYKFVLFTNDKTDLAYCKDRFSFLPGVSYIENPGYSLSGSEDFHDLMLMSLFDHNIIANSSYSYIAAYSNKNVNKIVVAPKNYVKAWSELANVMNGVWCPNWWNLIDNKV